MPRHRQLFYLADAIDSASMLVATAHCWLSPRECDALAAELEPLVHQLAEKIQARVPELILPFTLEDDPRIDEVVEYNTRDLRDALAHLG